MNSNDGGFNGNDPGNSGTGTTEADGPTTRFSTSPTSTTRRPSAATAPRTRRPSSRTRRSPTSTRRASPPSSPASSWMRSTTRTRAAPTRPARPATRSPASRRAGFIAALGLQHPQDVGPLDRLERRIARGARGDERLRLSFRHAFREQVGTDLLRAREDDRALERVQLPDVARPLVLLKRLDRPGLEPLHGFLAHRRDAVEEVLRQHRDVVTPLTQRGQIGWRSR